MCQTQTGLTVSVLQVLLGCTRASDISRDELDWYLWKPCPRAHRQFKKVSVFVYRLMKTGSTNRRRKTEGKGSVRKRGARQSCVDGESGRRGEGVGVFRLPVKY